MMVQFGDDSCCSDTCQMSSSAILAGATEELLRAAAGSNESMQRNCSKLLSSDRNPSESLNHSRTLLICCSVGLWFQKIAETDLTQRSSTDYDNEINCLNCITFKVTLGTLERFHSISIHPKRI